MVSQLPNNENKNLNLRVVSSVDDSRTEFPQLTLPTDSKERHIKVRMVLSQILLFGIPIKVNIRSNLFNIIKCMTIFRLLK